MPTLDLQVGAGSDDVYRRQTDDYFGTTDTVVVAGRYSTLIEYGGCMRFLNVTIPQGATITSAYLTLRSNGAYSVDTVNSRIRAENTDNATQITSGSDYDSRWSAGTAQVDWDAIGHWVSGADYQSPDISSVIQAIVNRAGWVSGNAINIFWTDHDKRSSAVNDCYRLAYSYNGSTTYAPKLHVEYTEVTAKTSSDSGSGVDGYVSLEQGEVKTSSDTGSGVEGTPVSSASLAGAESGSGIEAFVARLLAAFDTGGGVEASSVESGLLENLFASELGRGCDLLTAKIEMPTKGGGMKLWT